MSQTTYVCIEVDTENISLWKIIDEKLYSELGLSHVVWGVNRKKNNESVACKLPSNLYVAEVSCSAADLCTKVYNILEQYRTTFVAVAMAAPTWSHQDKRFERTISNTWDTEELESRAV